ncbi:WD40/YVTN/BNR-like repeat-containing protein [Amphritea japonica]|uniref:Photosynthesis system II assembly factor Ycf48/Hcf136-like domain-containing protein n=1 Tax=Amphritea japonica ATCC BAA-1530 TaxID=1278309 RepID=A0A7R6PQ72_9GAMM|nr:YCF48-related protein [Amphritea japonica]BBB27508.1 conserved hypothetical protein [Amphritea japonica ATCC BAA-1530]
MLQNQPVLRCLLLALVLFGTDASMVLAADRLSTPAISTTRAEQALLLDISSVGGQLVAVGDQGTIVRSGDHGVTWQQLQTPFSVMLTSIFFTDNQYGWLVGHDGLLAESQDGGVSWRKLLDGDQINQLRLSRLKAWVSELEAQLDSEPDNETLAEQLDTAQWQTEDAAAALEEGPSVPLLDIWFADAQRGFALGGYGLLLKTEDGGQSWQYWGDRLDNPDSFHLNAMIADHRGYLYVIGEAGLLFRSIDQGEHWERLDSPYDGSFFAITEYQNNLYLMGLRGHLYRSEDGLEWQTIETGFSASLVGAITSESELLLLGHGGVVLQSEDGQRFSRIDSGGRRSISAGAGLPGQYVLVGEGGVWALESTNE